jgi:hypothetical protein
MREIFTENGAGMLMGFMLCFTFLGVLVISQLNKYG